MKRSTSLLLLLTLVPSLPAPAYGILIVRGAGMIYDTDRDITWLQEMNYARVSGWSVTGCLDWYQATEWTQGLVYGGFDDWRLPSMLDLAGEVSLTDNEIAHLYFDVLGNGAAFPLSYGPFSLTGDLNPQLIGFWLAEEDGSGFGAGYFHWALPGSESGFTDYHFKNGFVGGEFLSGGFETDGLAWAVRSGDVGWADEPPSAALLAAALAPALILRRRRRP